jgi:hypothetical protein
MRMSEQQEQEQELLKDRHFTPWRTAATPAASALVVEVRERYLKHEAHVAPRRRARRQADQRIFDRQIEAIVAELAYEHLVDAGRWVSTTFSKTKLGNQGRYGSVILNNTYPAVVKLLSDPALGLVDRMGGSRFDWEGDGVKQTTIKADHELIKLIGHHRLSVSDFRVADSGEVIILKREKAYFSDEKEMIPYEDNEETNRFRAEVQRINHWLDEADIDFDEGMADAFADPHDRHLKRVFNNSSFQQGGRLYGGFWQKLTKGQRADGIFINGSPITTLDFGQIAPRIMYGMANAQPTFEDAYSLPSIDSKYRSGIKKVFNSLLHLDKRPASFPKGTRSLIKDPRIKVDHVINAILEVHAPIAHLFYANQGLRIMFKESQILIAALGRLIDEDIVALPIHDALVVEVHHAPLVREIMINTFKEHTGVGITVSTDDG